MKAYTNVLDIELCKNAKKEVRALEGSVIKLLKSGADHLLNSAEDTEYEVWKDAIQDLGRAYDRLNSLEDLIDNFGISDEEEDALETVADSKGMM